MTDLVAPVASPPCVAPCSCSWSACSATASGSRSRYGPQAGDGLPTVDRAAAEADIVEAVASYLDALR